MDVQLFRRAEGAVCLDVEDVEHGLLPVDDVRLVCIGVEGDDLRHAAVGIGLTQGDAARLLHGQPRRLFKTVFFDLVDFLCNALALAVYNGLVFRGQFRIICFTGVCGVVVGIGEVFAADRLLFRLDIFIPALVHGRDLRRFRVVALHGEHVYIPRGAVLVRHRAGKGIRQLRLLAEQGHGNALVVQLHVPLHVACGDLPRAVGDGIDLPAADEEVPLGCDRPLQCQRAPRRVAAVGRRLIVGVPALQRYFGIALVVQFDKAVGDGFGVIGSAEHLVDHDVRHGDVVFSVRRIGRACSSFLREGGDGHGAQAQGGAEARREHAFERSFHKTLLSVFCNAYSIAESYIILWENLSRKCNKSYHICKKPGGGHTKTGGANAPPAKSTDIFADIFNVFRPLPARGFPLRPRGSRCRLRLRRAPCSGWRG